MRPVTRYLVVSLTALAGCGSTPDAAVRESRIYDAETFFSTVSVFGSSVSADGRRVLVSTNESGVYNVVALPVDGGPAIPLTSSDTDALLAIGWFKDDDRFLFTADQGGDELNHVFVQHEDGTAVDLTPGERLKATFAGFTNDGTAFLVQTNERDPMYFDLYRYLVPDAVGEAGAGAGAYPRELVFENEAGFSLGPVSRDGRLASATKTVDNRKNLLFVVSLDDPNAEPIAVMDGVDASFQPQAFAPDSTSLYFTCDHESEFQRLWELDLATGESRLVAARDWDIAAMRFTRDGRYRVLAVNEDARTVLEVQELATGQPVELPDVPGGRTVSSFDTSWDGETWVLGAALDSSPTELFAAAAGVGSARQLTDCVPASIDPDDLVAPTTVRYPSFDGLEIPAVLFRPHGASEELTVPGIVWVHGGPGGQSRVGYRPTVQYLVNQGYAVLMVNNRGSSGYGKTFHHMDDRRHGDVDLKDCVFGRTYLESLDWVDGERIAIMGGSYGGYMVAAALAFEPLAFDCGIDIFGVTNWVRTLESVPPWWGAFRAALYSELGDPVVDDERLHAISPLFEASHIRRPLLVVQGANDPRVLQVESDELVAAVRANEVPVEYIVFPDEGHGFRNRKNEIAAARAYASFLGEHLGK